MKKNIILNITISLLLAATLNAMESSKEAAYQRIQSIANPQARLNAIKQAFGSTDAYKTYEQARTATSTPTTPAPVPSPAGAAVTPPPPAGSSSSAAPAPAAGTQQLPPPIVSPKAPVNLQPAVQAIVDAAQQIMDAAGNDPDVGMIKNAASATRNQFKMLLP